MSQETPDASNTGETSTPAGRSDRPTIADVAALARVSTTAVSKVFNDRGRISAPTRQRILTAAEKLGWSPSVTAGALRGARTKIFAMVLQRGSDLLESDPYFTELITGMESELAPRGYGLLIHLVGEDTEAEEETYRRLAQEGRADGVLLTESRIADPRYQLLRRLGLPAVLVGTPYGDDPVPSVHPHDPAAGVREAVRHLVHAGHRRIAHLAGPEDKVHTVFRRQVLAQALQDEGAGPADVISTDFTPEAAMWSTERLLDRAKRPTAVLYANDSMAVRGMSTAQRLGYQVPRDLSVVGYDDLPICGWVHPRLSTVRQDVPLAGREAARRLLELCGEPVDEPTVQPNPRLVVRESTGPAPDGD